MTVAQVEVGFNTVNGKHCCNEQDTRKVQLTKISFNTASGKYCCNYVEKEFEGDPDSGQFQYRKR